MHTKQMISSDVSHLIERNGEEFGLRVSDFLVDAQIKK
jgi:hypothetical protein